jgi:hypothetical protein
MYLEISETILDKCECERSQKLPYIFEYKPGTHFTGEIK